MSKTTELKPFSQNPRNITKKQFDDLSEFMKLGDLSGIVHDLNSNELVGGNQRTRVFNLADCEVTVTKVLDKPSRAGTVGYGYIEYDDEEFSYRQVRWTKGQCIAANIIANKAGGTFDFDMLANEYDPNDLLEFGFEPFEIGLEFNKEVEDIEADDPKNIKTDIKLGDLFEIGEHRLLCGDSTNSDQVARLLSGESPKLMITDPPYGVNYDPDWRNHTGMARSARAIGKVTNDDNSSWAAAYALSPSIVAYVWHASASAVQFATDLINCGFEIRSQIIWAKNNHAISRGAYHWKHEPCWYAVKKGSKSYWIGDRSQTTLWEIDKPLKSETGHSTQKPIECMAKPIRNHEGDVYDPFLGSGTTMVACEQLDRKLYGMEISPQYCQVIINRMLKLNPKLKVVKHGLRQTQKS